MRKTPLSVAVLIGLSAPALACGHPVGSNGQYAYDECGNVIGAASQYYTATSGTCMNCGTIVTTSSCCTASVDESTLAAWAARKAVENQQGDWWGKKKVTDLTRDEVDDRTSRLTKLREWAKTLSNHIFADAYCNWVDARSGELTARRADLDKLDVALSLVKGLPTPPDSAK